MTKKGFENMLNFIIFGDDFWKPWVYPTFKKGDKISFSIDGNYFKCPCDPKSPESIFQAKNMQHDNEECYIAIAQFDLIENKINHIDFMSHPFRIDEPYIDEDYINRIHLNEQSELMWFFIWENTECPYGWDINGNG